MLQQILLNKRDGISAARPEARWDFVVKAVSQTGMFVFSFQPNYLFVLPQIVFLLYLHN